MTADRTADLALILFAVGVVTTFGVRTWTHRRRTGRSGFSGITGPRWSAAWFGGAHFVTALVLAAAYTARVGRFVPGLGRTTAAAAAARVEVR